MSKVIYFYGVNEDYGAFSNFAPYPIRVGGKLWPTSEHYFQAHKFVEPRDAEAVRRAKTPMIAASLGRDRRRKLRPDWERARVEVMRTALRGRLLMELRKKLAAG